MMKKLSYEDFVKRAKRIHGEDYEYIKDSYTTTKKKMWIIHKKCNHKFQQTPHNHLQGQGCPKCCYKNRKTNYSFITKAKKLFGNKQSLLALILCMLFAPYYTYTPFYYTDSLSMPFLIGSVYLFVSAIKSENKYKRYALLVAFGGVVFLGFKMKATVIFALICGLVYVLLKFDIKRVATISLAVIVGFSTVGAVYIQPV